MLLITDVIQQLLFVFLGIITTRTSVDQTQRDQYMVRVSAVDGGGRAGYAVVRVDVMAVHAAMPTFLMTEYKANVFASAPPGTSVVKVHCVVECLDVTVIL